MQCTFVKVALVEEHFISPVKGDVWAQAQTVVEVPIVLVVNSQGELWRPWHSIAYIAGPATFVTIFINRLFRTVSQAQQSTFNTVPTVLYIFEFFNFRVQPGNPASDTATVIRCPVDLNFSTNIAGSTDILGDQGTDISTYDHTLSRRWWLFTFSHFNFFLV